MGENTGQASPRDEVAAVEPDAHGGQVTAGRVNGGHLMGNPATRKSHRFCSPSPTDTARLAGNSCSR